MFKKLVSNLPFSPSLISQLGFYATRLKKEQFVRKLGLIFTVFALVIQSFAIFNPPTSANAASTNDVLYGGCASKQCFLDAYNSNRQGFASLLNYLRISYDDLNGATWTRFRSGDYQHSFGRETKYARTGNVTTSDGTVFWFGPPPSPNYTGPGLVGNSARIGAFALMSDCGNPFVNNIAPAPCAVPGKGDLDNNDPRCFVPCKYNQNIPEGDANCHPPAASCVNLTATPINGIAGKTQFTFHINGSLAYGATWTGYYMKYSSNNGQSWQTGITGSLNPDGSGGPTNRGADWQNVFPQAGTYKVQGFLNTANAGNDHTSDQCITAVTVEPQHPSYDLAKTVDKTTAEPGDTVAYTLTLHNTGNIALTNVNIKDQLPDHMTLSGDPTFDPDTTKYSGDLFKEDGLTIDSVAAGATVTITYNAKIADREELKCGINHLTNKVTSTTKEVKDETDLTNNEATVDVTKNCNCSDEEISAGNIDCVTRKTAINNTQNGADATTVTANAGDVITYTLHIVNTTPNSDTVDINDFINDVLEYADLTDVGGGNFNPDNQLLSWTNVPLKTGERTERSFTVTVKNPIPAMAQGKSQPLSFDCIMSNSINSDINTGMHINVSCPAPKVVEQVVQQLPATGAGMNIFFGSLVAAVVVFFYARSRQLGKEVRLVRKEFSAGTI